MLSPLVATKEQAKRRRDALTEAGCSTYQLGYQQGELAIHCFCCGLTSFAKSDIEALFCGFCSAWHVEWQGGDRDGC